MFLRDVDEDESETERERQRAREEEKGKKMRKRRKVNSLHFLNLFLITFCLFFSFRQPA